MLKLVKKKERKMEREECNFTESSDTLFSRAPRRSGPDLKSTHDSLGAFHLLLPWQQHLQTDGSTLSVTSEPPPLCCNRMIEGCMCAW